VGIEAHLVVGDAVTWPKSWENDLYGIAMEALNNSLKHARASQVDVSLGGNGQGIDLEVSDNGRGFDLAHPGAGGLGLRSMAERAERMGGSLTVDAAAGCGTRVHLHVEAKL
jgi:signal transduction histidine kinase